MTVPEPFNIARSRPRPAPPVEAKPEPFKAKPVPISTRRFGPTAEQIAVRRAEARNREAVAAKYADPRLAFRLRAVERPSNVEKVRAEMEAREIAAIEAERASVIPIARSVPASNAPGFVDPKAGPVKTNAAAILRADAVLRARREKEMAAVEDFEAGLRDSSEYEAWRSKMRLEDEANRAVEVAKTREASVRAHEEARAARAEAAARDAERAHLSLTRRRLAAERAREASAIESSRLATRVAETESRLASCEMAMERWRERAVSLETAFLKNRLAPDQATDCFLKAGFLAHYWRLAYRLGIEPRSSWREAELWTERAPAGGDTALLNVVRAVRDAADAGVGQGPAFCRAVFGDAKRGDESAETNPKTEDAYAARAPAPRRAGGWAPATLADLAEVETAMRGLVSARIEEAVLVALADRRRALAVRVATSETSETRFENLKTEDARDAGASPRRDGSPWRRDKGTSDFSTSASPLPEPARLTTGDGLEPWIVLSDAEINEVKYRRLWVCWQWARARGRAHDTALAGLAEPRCDTWFRRAFGEQAVFAAAREALEVEGALAEIRALGVERALCAAASAAT